MNKALRERIYSKYNGHCAYCGTHITLSEMQVDHLQPKWHNLSDEECGHKGIDRGTDDENNLMPACRACNYYKGTSTLDGFRARLAVLQSNVMESFNARLALKYQMISLQTWDGKFYCERSTYAETESSNQNSEPETKEEDSAIQTGNDNSESERKRTGKFESGEDVYFMHNNKVRCKHITSRLIPYDGSDILYHIMNIGTFTENQLFKTKEELIKSL